MLPRIGASSQSEIDTFVSVSETKISEQGARFPRTRENRTMPETDANPLSGSDLAAFVAAMDAASVHGAADSLNLTPSAVTKRLQSLERRAGVQLFERGRFGLRSTPTARLLYAEARNALDALERVRDVLAEQAGSVDRALSIAASLTVGEFLLPGWLAAFRVDHPQVRAQVDIVNSPGVVASIREHAASIGFVEGVDALDGLDVVLLHDDEIVAVVDARHRWARRRSIAARELVREPYLAREAGSGTRAVVAAALAGAGIELTPSLEVASTQSVKRALASGGFALLSRLAIQAEQASGSLRALPVRDLDLTRRLKAIRDPAQRPPPQTRQFWTWLNKLRRD
jgi:DNA-binding transcriptional LysR family regulator